MIAYFPAPGLYRHIVPPDYREDGCCRLVLGHNTSSAARDGEHDDELGLHLLGSTHS